jgi:hypothetical protein
LSEIVGSEERGGVLRVREGKVKEERLNHGVATDHCEEDSGYGGEAVDLGVELSMLFD